RFHEPCSATNARPRYSGGNMFPFVEHESQRCGMRLEQHGGNDALRDEIAAASPEPRIFMSTDVRVRPSIESAVVDFRHIVRHELVAETIALVDRRPERSCFRLERETNRIAQSAGERARTAAIRLHDYDRCASHVALDVHIAGGTDRDKQLRAVAAEEDVAGDVAAGRQRDETLRRIACDRLPR